MRNVGSKIVKLIKGFESKGYLVFVNSEQNFSSKMQSVFTFYKVKITTPEDVNRSREIRNRISEIVKKLKDKDCKEEWEELREEKEDLNIELAELKPQKYEISSKVKVMLFLASKYKEVIEDEGI